MLINWGTWALLQAWWSSEELEPGQWSWTIFRFWNLWRTVVRPLRFWFYGCWGGIWGGFFWGIITQPHFCFSAGSGDVLDVTSQWCSKANGRRKAKSWGQGIQWDSYSSPLDFPHSSCLWDSIEGDVKLFWHCLRVTYGSLDLAPLLGADVFCLEIDKNVDLR